MLRLFGTDFRWQFKLYCFQNELKCVETYLTHIYPRQEKVSEFYKKEEKFPLHCNWIQINYYMKICTLLLSYLLIFKNSIFYN